MKQSKPDRRRESPGSGQAGREGRSGSGAVDDTAALPGSGRLDR